MNTLLTKAGSYARPSERLPLSRIKEETIKFGSHFLKHRSIWQVSSMDIQSSTSEESWIFSIHSLDCSPNGLVAEILDRRARQRADCASGSRV